MIEPEQSCQAGGFTGDGPREPRTREWNAPKEERGPLCAHFPAFPETLPAAPGSEGWGSKGSKRRWEFGEQTIRRNTGSAAHWGP